MDYDDKISEGHKSANAENSKSSPVVPPFALPKYDFDDSLQGDLRFEGLVENEVFLGISSQEDSQWIEDFSRGNNGIEFSSSATEPCSISRHNNVWSEATSSESVAMLLKSVGQEERIQGETLIQELDTGNELGNLATEMEPNLKKDDKVESITTSQPTATPDSFLDRRNVNAVESKKDNVPVDGSSGVVSIVSSVILSEADEGPDDKCDDTTHLKVNIIDQPVDNLEGCNIDQGSAVTSQLGNVEVGACNKGEKTSEPIQNPLGDTSSVACVDAHTFEVVNKDAEYSACTGVEVSIVELKENSFGNQPNSLERQNVEAVDIKTVNSSCPEHDMDSVVENENSENCSGGVAVAEASSLLAADHKFTEQVEGSGIEYAENPDTSVSCIVSGSQCGIQLSSKDSSDLRTSGVLEDNNSPEAQTSSFVVGGHVQMSKSHISSGQEDVHLFDKDVSSLGTEDAKSLTTSLPPDESNKANIVQGAELLNSASNERGSEVTDEMNLSSCGMPIDPPLLHGSKTTADGATFGEQEHKSQVANLLGTESSPQVSADLEPFSFPESGQASRINQEAGPEGSKKVEACPSLISSEIKLVDDAALAAHKSNEEIYLERSAELASSEVADAVLPSSQTLVPVESVPVSMLESSTISQKNDDVTATSGTELTENPSTKVDSPEKNEDSVSLACPSKCISDIGNMDGDASANSFEENVYTPAIISCAKAPLSEKEQKTRTIEVSIGDVQHPEATDGAAEMVQSVPLDATFNNGEISTSQVNMSTGLTEGKIMKDMQLNPVQVHERSTDVKEYPSDGNMGPPSVVSCVKIPISETGQTSRGKDASVSTVHHSEGTAGAGENVQSAALHMEHDNSNEGTNISMEVSSSTGLSESEIIKGSPSYPSIPVNKISTDVEGYPLAADCSRIDLTMPEHSLENSEGPGPMSGKKRAGARGTSERKTRLGSVKTTARTNSRKRGMQETPSKQFDEDKSMMISSLPGNSNAELSGIKVCGALPTPMSTIPDLNTSVTPAYYQQPFTDTQQVQLRAQILVYGSLMQNSVPDEACMIAAFGPSDGSGGCLWECAWRACSERIQTQKSDASNLETPVRSFSGSKGSDQPVKKSKSSRQSKSTLPADRASSKDIPSPVVNPIIPLSSPLWNVSTPSGVGLQSSGTYVDYHQPFGPLQPCQPQGTKGFGEQNPSWLSQINFPGQWVATPQTSSLDVNASVSSKFCTEPVKLTPSKVSSVPSDPARKQTQFSVSTGGSAGLSSGIHFQTDVTKTSVLPGQICDNTKHKKRKKVSVSKSPGQIPSLTLDQAASLSDTSNHISKKGTAPQAIFQNSLLAPSLPEMRSPAVNNASSMPNAATATFLGSTGRSSNNLPAVYPLVSSDQPTRVDQIVDKNSIMSEESLNAVEAARLQAEGAAAHAAAAVGNCNGVWSQLSKLKNSGLRFDDETKLSSAAMAIAAAASVAKAAAAAAKLASNIAIGAKLMADEVSTASVTRKDPHSTGMSMACSSNSSLLAGEGNVSTSSIITAAKETVKKRVEAATAASKHAENLDAMVKAAELAAEAVSQAGKIVSIGDPLPLSELLGSGPMDYWRTPQVFPEQGVIAGIDQRKTFVPEKLVPAQPPKDGAIVTGEAVDRGTIASVGKNSLSTQRGHRASDPALDSYGGTNSEIVKSRDAQRISPLTSLENVMVEGCFVEVFKEGGKYKAAWYPAKILNSDDEKAFVCYTELQADDGSGKLKEWVPLKGDNSKAPIIRIPHPATSMCFERSRKRRRAAVMDYTWCVGDRVDAWMQDCWLEGVVSEKKNDETTFKISIPALGGTSAVKTWNLRPTVTWQDGKWIECPSAVQQSPTQGDTPQEKRVKLGHPAVEAAKVDKSLRGNDLMESKEHDESRQLPLLASEKEFNIGNNTGDIKLDAPRIARTGLQKEGSRVVFGVPKPGKKRKFMDVSKHLDSDQCNKNAKTSDLVKTARYLPQGRGGGRGWNNNTKDDIKEKQAKEDKVKVIRSGVAQKTNALLSAKSMGKTVSKEQNNPALRDLMEFGSVSNSPSEGPTSSKGPRVPNKRVPSSSTKTVLLNKGKHAAGGEVDKKVDPHVTEIRRSNRKIQPTSRLLEGLQSSLIGSKMPSVPHEKVQKNLNRGDSSSHG
ncbi:uncharacterized protein LOC108199235 isoform X2 [Daucus carota subsp. sativus]|uniref:uncharacterized protein LOC108199235 isoform X2 n=1 Tax=Daucus carota subsp. sativus TaxID=79200 RepID=UPI0007EF132D|nr:PREDICTED: uncharacterized protein LOC108199235 isoform X2 [Daucus carota subsp. sativus]